MAISFCYVRELINVRYQLQRQEKDKRDYKLYRCSLIERILNIFKKPVLPNSVDLRDKMPEVYDQLALGSCSAQSTTAYRVFLSGDKTLQLSRLFQYYKTREIEGTVNEDSGCTNRDAMKSMAKNGICIESLMPYDIDKFTVAPSKEAITNALNYRIKAYHSVKNLTQIKQALNDGMPVVLGMKVYESFEYDEVAKTGVMPMPKKFEKYLGGHSVLCVGFSDDKKCLIIRNSWGETWGDEGYFYLSYDYVKAYTFDYWVCSI